MGMDNSDYCGGGGIIGLNGNGKNIIKIIYLKISKNKMGNILIKK